jgi:uncharacterized protein (DUF849 family)
MMPKSKKNPLPSLMVAPNGARRGKTAHPSLPLTDHELLQTAKDCQKAGADGIHIHIRDDDGKHMIDSDRYNAVLELLAAEVPELYLQVTSESAGLYGAREQQEMVRALKPRYVSVAMREMVRAETDWPKATDFYQWAEDSDVEIQHILYSTSELSTFLNACSDGRIPGQHQLLQLVQGTYDGSEQSDPKKIKDFTKLIDASGLSIDWGLCAFGVEETSCLIEAVRQGGKARVGFENSLWHADGSLAQDNAARVKEVKSGIDALASA